MAPLATPWHENYRAMWIGCCAPSMAGNPAPQLSRGTPAPSLQKEDSEGHHTEREERERRSHHNSRPKDFEAGTEHNLDDAGGGCISIGATTPVTSAPALDAAHRCLRHSHELQ
jgi:hypothetical protein